MECINNAFEGARAFTHMMDEIKKVDVPVIDVHVQEDSRRCAVLEPDFLMDGNRAQRRAAAKQHRKEVKRERHTVK